ncbi:MAG TPA: hypothetical protein VK153_03790 [Candidatus Paceibacterota bacterium]|nr:hypothetical protein [Candidatus Paceibacterota bacterium]
MKTYKIVPKGNFPTISIVLFLLGCILSPLDDRFLYGLMGTSIFILIASIILGTIEEVKKPKKENEQE